MLESRRAHCSMQMQSQLTVQTTSSLMFGWSNRIILAALAGILFLTLFPFRLDLHSDRSLGLSPFLLEGSVKISGPLDVFLNVLLFVPLGFGVAGKLRERGISSLRAAILVTGVAALLSYSIEFAQIYIPGRDSGWEDVFTNSLGALVGFGAFNFCGPLTLRFLSRVEACFENWLSLRHVAWILSLYFAFWFALSVPFQYRTRLGSWALNARLFFGNDASARYPWKGQVFLAQFWDRAIPPQLARKLTAHDSATLTADHNDAASYYFSGAAPFRDSRQLLPLLQWTKQPSALSADPPALVLNGFESLVSQGTAAELVTRIERNNQFSIHVTCAPAQTDQNGAILSISPQSGLANLNLRQQGSDLVFWFRNGLSDRYRLLWHVFDVFQKNKSRDILYSYDGSVLSLYIDGHPQPHVYQLSPGATLAHLIGRSKTAELAGYKEIYYAILFLPAGFLIGLLGRKPRADLSERLLFRLLLVSALILPITLDLLLAQTSQRAISSANIVLSLGLLAGGGLWIIADPRTRAKRDAPTAEN